MSKSPAVRVGALVSVAVLLLAGCAAAPDKNTDDGGGEQSCARMVTNSGGLDDRSFNDASWKGMQDAADEFGINVDVLVSTSETDLAPNVQQAVDTGCEFILTVGYELTPATIEQAASNPDVNFAIVDDVADAPNIKPLVFDTAQAAFLAGYLAAGVSTTGKVATFGGGNQPPVTLFMDGFVDGVAKYNEVHGTAVISLGWNKEQQDGVFTGDFEDINKGLTVTQGLIDQGADVILPVAGQVGEGAVRAALDSGGRASIIWVDTDGYDVLSPDFRPVILTSVLKNTGDAVVSIVKSSIDGTFDNSPYIGTLENGGVDIAPFHDLESKVTPELMDEIDQLRAAIISGAVSVTSPSTPR
ncbi:BMP family ABC transporter substrate-binding protein [Salinibacterium sp. G-O1]|uniref:BMP family lipoprotein n=1 Tax=Salinibacterium sp. G-O1 TaxID=3046208 RepID=UPI0024B996AA|nr:BMP family ABC transporter substrate-binding protein [Salinibacterium sp. G-O1]MDJ0336477.1 BMP family ABC transporter substrate-binding protein [Salinibacterium sp. G-O1]